MKLLIGNKCYSSWSLRAWLLLAAKEISFEEVLVLLDEPGFKDAVHAHAPQSGGTVPTLVDGDVAVWETLAIVEYLHERFPERGIWPSDAAARAHARAVSSEMHASFQALRGACPMNLGKRYATRDRGADVTANVTRISAIWGEARRRFGEAAGGPFLYGEFSAADAMFAPVVARLDTYAIPVDGVSAAYMRAVLGLPAYRQWLDAALKESWIVEHDEVDEPAIANLRSV
ncbi:glutathione S-transferase family protein [Bosea caraganae]|uniref:Glutathione S-transferase family protein n=1 Tax=Bosea caraganae TaxID=2763117 RepID=A0A370LBE6_9HYPH|nr:glutathione S-transferase family protein [Bosea caraganae]RDJ27143.1 glutathione S-transferase family protein [Bosea caraganae]RDJ29160.1 glutathione S-transferase family protein [Bosea caraganae]